jgi:hypothetical protein
MLSVYAGPAGKGVQRASNDWSALVGRQPEQLLDFAASDNWWNVSGEAWMLGPHRDSGKRLEYSLPLLTDDPTTSLSACAAGAYDRWWTRLGTNLVNMQLAGAVVRPGWEANGGTYRWAQAEQRDFYVTCFRRVVDRLRAVPGQRFAISWSMLSGPTPIDARVLYPGDDYVDVVGVSAYDMGFDIVNQPRGLAWWAQFAKDHRKPLALDEWGVTWRALGDSGGDRSGFITDVFNFMQNPNNGVVWANYFDYGTSTDDHRLTGAATRFPQAAAQMRLEAARVPR